MEENKDFPSELRHDLASGNWVIIAKGRAKKPGSFKQKMLRNDIEEKDCPFCNIETQGAPILICTKEGEVMINGKIPENWSVVVIPNKYPALIPSLTLSRREEGGLFQTLDAVGHCELIVPRHHKKNIADFNIGEIKVLLDICQKRYLDLMHKPFVSYISMFQNYGIKAGASQNHPHFQIITTPLIDVDLLGSLSNAKKYFEEKKKCIYCQIIDWELKSKKRVVYENKHFVAVCPFASKAAFQVIISPKKHLTNFEEINEEEKNALADIAKVVSTVLRKALGDHAYNFYLHTSPCDGQEHPYYHWHWAILPKTGQMAGFELGTYIEISTIEPEKAAEHLRSYL